MANQLNFLEWPDEDRAPLVEPAHDPREGSIEARARRFHEANPQVYRMAVRVARHHAFYARWIMEQEADLAGFFHTRETARDPDYRSRSVRGPSTPQPDQGAPYGA